MRAAWQNQNLRRMGKYEPSPLKMLIRAFLRGNDLKAFLFHQSAFSAFPRLCHLKPTTATTTWNSKQKHHSAIFCFFRRYFFKKNMPSCLMQISYKRVKTCYKIKIGFRDLLGVFVGFFHRCWAHNIQKSHFYSPIVPLLECKSGAIVW